MVLWNAAVFFFGGERQIKCLNSSDKFEVREIGINKSSVPDIQ